MIRSLVLLSCCLLASCTVLPERAPVNLYQLPPSSHSASADSVQLSGLRLARPATSDALGGRRLLVMAEDNNYQAYPDARWTAAIPSLWRDWMLDAFWRDGRISDLSTDSERLQADLELGGILRALHTEYINGRPEAVIRYDARLVDINSRQILASRRFEATEPVAGSSAADVVRALGLAAEQMALQLIDWTLEESLGQAQ